VNLKRVYIETTVISYLTARPSSDLIVAAHQQITNEWWGNLRGAFDLFVSQLVIREAGGGDPEAAGRRLQVIDTLSLLDITQEAEFVASRLLAASLVPAKAAEDALHIALAATHGMDFLLTWNCKHIANAAIREAVAGLLLAGGYKAPVICTPEELMEG
jgi:predicted nucleic acid-binding protein